MQRDDHYVRAKSASTLGVRNDRRTVGPLETPRVWLSLPVAELGVGEKGNLDTLGLEDRDASGLLGGHCRSRVLNAIATKRGDRAVNTVLAMVKRVVRGRRTDIPPRHLDCVCERTWSPKHRIPNRIARH